MAAFMVVSRQPNPTLNANVDRVYGGGAHLKLSDTDMIWLVADAGVTTKDVCDKLDIKQGGGITGAVVTKIESYFGLAAPNIWEWLKVKVAEP